ncbi:MAG TPA: TerC family protein [Noviherbaspirillum sp.]|uniref:TerC family protein n=1 Tax=Noviherbaspirillum sp. TaxID=1926288 RepID=UPI002DDC8FF8|nr:TerC family protein [Noviherbaspirillum sp.]HEV2611620.1 TerC family protein [Noviherbaspirillum sp.]
MVESIGAWWMWAGFFALVLAMIAVDLLLLGGKTAHKVTLREAAGWSVVWVVMALLFNAALWWHLDGTAGREIANEKSLEFLTGYVIEKSLAVDNIFVWLVIFSYFAVPAEFQRRVLLYGVLGAIVMRTVMVFAGAWLISEFHWILYFFGLLLLATGVKMLIFADKQPDLEANPALRWMRKHMKVTDNFHGERFFIISKGVRYATPLFLVLVLVEITDLIFAVDSIPAIFAITSDPFIVLTSNVFAILGLRAMYFLLKDVADRFHLLKYGLAFVLMFVGTKMLIVDFYKIPVLLSLAVVGTIIGLSVVASLIWTKPRSTPSLQLSANKE